MPSVHGHRIISDETTIIISRMIVTNKKTDDDRMKAVIDIVTIDIEQTMTTTEMTDRNHGIQETIGVTLIEVRETIDRTGTIVVENLLNPNCTALFPTMSRGPTRPTKD